MPLFLYFFSQSLDYIDRTVVFGMSGQAVCFYGKCLHVALGLGESSFPSFRPSPCHPSHLAPHRFLQHGFRVVLCTKPSVVLSPRPPALPTRGRNLFFLEIKHLASQTITHEYPHASQTGFVLPASVPSQSLLPLPTSPAPEAL